MSYSTVTPIKFYDLSRYLTENDEPIDQKNLIAELSSKFNVPPENIEIDPSTKMSIIHYA